MAANGQNKRKNLLHDSFRQNENAIKIQLLSANDARKLDEALSVRVTYDTSELLVPELELKLQWREIYGYLILGSESVVLQFVR